MVLLVLDISNIENLDEINNKKNFAKIPNDIFYNGGNILHGIGGRDGFLIYCLLTSRKSMSNTNYISIKEISNVIQFEKNISRSKNRIVKSLLLLKECNYVDFQEDVKKLKINETVRIEWIEQFPRLGGEGWIKFVEDDFEVYEKIGGIAYCVMWILRMYKNYKTKTSYISISDITDILGCDRNKVQNAVNLFKTTGLFNIINGEYYHHEGLGRSIRQNNSYEYTNNIESILSMSDVEIYNILFPHRK